MDEKYIEMKLIRAVRQKGGKALKFVSPGFAGVPDRLVLLPGEHMGFVELKRPGEAMRPLQKRRMLQLENLGFKVYCINTVEMIEDVLKDIQKGGDET